MQYVSQKYVFGAEFSQNNKSLDARAKIKQAQNVFGCAC